MNLFGRIKVKETLRISRKGLLKLLSENEHMQKQITELQASNTELLMENRDLRNAILKQRFGDDDSRRVEVGSCETTHWDTAAS